MLQCGASGQICLVVNIKQISEVEKKPFTSSLNISPEACCIKGEGAYCPPPRPSNNTKSRNGFRIDTQLSQETKM
jgi:hypothetical protein